MPKFELKIGCQIEGCHAEADTHVAYFFPSNPIFGDWKHKNVCKEHWNELLDKGVTGYEAIRLEKILSEEKVKYAKV